MLTPFRRVKRLVWAVLALAVPTAVLSQAVDSRAMRRIPSSSSGRQIARRPGRGGRRGREDWDLDFPDADIELPLLDHIDEDTTEKAWCLDATVDPARKRLIVRDIITATVTREEAGRVDFTCPPGTIPLHRHYGDYRHDTGPSVDDQLVARRQHLVGVVMYVAPGREWYQYILYGQLP